MICDNYINRKGMSVVLTSTKSTSIKNNCTATSCEGGLNFQLEKKCFQAVRMESFPKNWTFNLGKNVSRISSRHFSPPPPPPSSLPPPSPPPPPPPPPPFRRRVWARGREARPRGRGGWGRGQGRAGSGTPEKVQRFKFKCKIFFPPIQQLPAGLSSLIFSFSAFQSGRGKLAAVLRRAGHLRYSWGFFYRKYQFL